MMTSTIQTPLHKRFETKCPEVCNLPPARAAFCYRENPGEMEAYMAFFSSAIDTLQTLVIALGAGLGVWGVVNLLEGYGSDNPGSKSQGMKQFMAN